VHYFVGDRQLVRRYLDLGCIISVGKPVTRPENDALRLAVADTSLDRLLLETDTYPLPGRTTEPRDLRDVCAAVAEIKRTSAQEVAAITTKSFVDLIARSHPRPRRAARGN
jgi:TatD DNase family protein